MFARKIRDGQWKIWAVSDADGGCELLDFLAALDRDVRNRVLSMLDAVAQQGTRVIPSDRCHIVDDNDPIYQFTCGQVRILWFYDRDKIILCSHGFLKKSQKTPKKEKVRAKKSLQVLPVGACDLLREEDMKNYVDIDALFEEARKTPEYKVERLVLEFTSDIERRMQARGMTRAQLARKLGVSKPYVTKLFRGEGNYTLDTMVRVADAVGADLHQRLCNDGSGMRWFEIIPGQHPAFAAETLAETKAVASTEEFHDDLAAAA